MSGIFFGCYSLEFLPDIFKWKTENVIDMSFLFANCLSLYILPDISIWKTNNVDNMCGMFLNCKKLLSLPNICEWNINEVTNVNFMFCNCSSLDFISNNVIDKFNNKDIIYKLYTFFNVPAVYFVNDLNSNNKLFIEFFYETFWELCLNIKNIAKCLEYKTIFLQPTIPKFFIDYYSYLTKISNNYSSIYSICEKPIFDNNNIKIHRFIMIYKIEKQMKKVRILGQRFVENNKNKGVIIFQNHKFPLKEEIKITDKKDRLKV